MTEVEFVSEVAGWTTGRGRAPGSAARSTGSDQEDITFCWEQPARGRLRTHAGLPGRRKRPRSPQDAPEAAHQGQRDAEEAGEDPGFTGNHVHTGLTGSRQRSRTPQAVPEAMQQAQRGPEAWEEAVDLTAEEPEKLDTPRAEQAALGLAQVRVGTLCGPASCWGTIERSWSC